jgi:hypothetical protein
MTTSLNVLSGSAYPPLFINQYVIDQLKQFTRTEKDSNGDFIEVPLYIKIPGKIDPIVPVQATNIDDLYSEITVTDSPFLIAYDRLVRYSQDTAYWCKREQLVYTIHSTDSEKGFDISRVILETLDREDAAAQDVNAWIAKNDIFDKFGRPVSNNVFFHNFRVFQIDETRDIVELGSVKFNWRGKIIIEYDYHANTSSSYN